MKPHTFIVQLPAHPGIDVGLFAKVTLEDPYDYDEDMIQGAKEALAGLYNVPESAVSTTLEFGGQLISGV